MGIKRGFIGFEYCKTLRDPKVSHPIALDSEKSLAVALSCPTYKKMNLLAETGSVQYSMEDPAMLRRGILRK